MLAARALPTPPPPRQVMGYSGTVPSEPSSGSRVHRGANHQDRQRAPPARPRRSRVGVPIRPEVRQGTAATTHGQPETITALAWKAQQRLCSRYRRLLARGKPTPHVITVVARELVGFIGAIGVAVERELVMAA